MAPAARPCLVLFALTVGCAAPEIRYEALDATFAATAQPRAHSSVDVYLYSQPSYEYRVVGRFQEESPDSLPGGRDTMAVAARAMAADQGCDAVIVGGNVSTWSGDYEWRRPPIDWAAVFAGTERMRRSAQWMPAFEEHGLSAECVVRTDARPDVAPPALDESLVPTIYPVFAGPGK